MTISKPSILVAEDEEVVALDLQHTLADLAYSVSGIASSGREAVDLTAQTRPDLVLMDITLKGTVDGIQAAHEIRDRYHVPVVFLTADADRKTISRANEAAPYGYLTKPWRSRELHAAIQVALHQHRLVETFFLGQSWLSNLMASISDGVIAADNNAIVQYVNSSAERLLGFASTEAIGSPLERVFFLTAMSGEHVVMCQLRKAIALNQSTGKERFYVRTKTGRKVAIEDGAAPVIQNGKVTGAVSVFRDITHVLRQEQKEKQTRHRLEEEVEVTSRALGQSRSELRALSLHLMSAQEDERRRLARDLHDDVGQQTALLEMNLVRLSMLLPENEECSHLLSSIKEQMAELSGSVRQISHTLYPTILSDLGLLAGLRSLIEDFRNGGMNIHFAATGSFTPLPIDVSTALYRICQEALRNITKHAPRAHVEVTLSESNGHVHLSVEDDGPGFNLDERAQGGLGLLSIQERARSLGGCLELQTAPGQGVSVLVKIPVN